MGHRQPHSKGVALCWAALLLSCGSANKPTASEPGRDRATDEASQEAVQINAIAAAINEFGPAVHTCWARAAADDFRLEGRVVLDLTMAKGGVGAVSIAEDEVDDPVLTNCLKTLWGDYEWPEVFAAGDRIQLPPFEFVAPEAQYTVASAHVPVQTLAEGHLEVMVLLDEANTGNAQAALSRLSLNSGLVVPMHTHTSAEVLFVLSGTGTVQSAGASQSVKPGSGIYIAAGVPHGFSHTGKEPVELVQLYTPGGPEGRFKDAAKTAGTTPVSGPLPKRSPRPIVHSVADSTVYRIGGGKMEARILFDQVISGDRAAYLGALTAKPGTAVPPHRHSTATELLLVLEGQANMVVAGRSLSLRPGDAVQIPSGVLHQASIHGVSDFKAVQFYTPAGPEQRFKSP